MTTPSPVQILTPTKAESNLLIIGDGFGSGLFKWDFATFEMAAAAVALAISLEPWFQRAPHLGVWKLRYPPEPADPAIQIDGCVLRPTPVARSHFGATFNGPEACHLLTGQDGDVLEFVELVEKEHGFKGPFFRQVLVLVNSNLYGGCSTGSIAWASLAPGLAARLALHEIGHTFDLSDEYENDCGEASNATWLLSDFNVSTNTNTPPWNHWIGSARPRVDKAADTDCYAPSPYPNGIVGLFEGGSYYHKGYYRPSHRCRMRAISDPFCPMCDMHLARVLDPNLPDAFL